MLDWTALRDFLSVVESGSLSAAAKRLRVSQPTVSRRIAALEASLNARLFNRTPRGLELTEAGETILRHTQSMEREALSAERAVTGSDTGLDGTVRISMTGGLGVEWLTAELAAFRRRYDDIRLEVVIDNAPVNLLRREADIAVRLFRPEQADLIARRVGRNVVGLFANADYLNAHGRPRTVAELAGHDIIGFDEAFAQMGQARWLGANVAQEQIIFRSNSLLAQLAAVRAGIGIGAVSCLIGRRDPRLERVLADVDVVEQEIWLVTHGDLRRSARIRAAFDFLAEVIIAHRDALADHTATAPEAKTG